MIRCTVAFAGAVFDGEMTVEGVTARGNQLCGSDETYRTRIYPCDGRSTCSLLDELETALRGGRYSGETEFGNAGRYGTSNNPRLGRALLQEGLSAVIETNRGHWLWSGDLLWLCAGEYRCSRQYYGAYHPTGDPCPAAGIMRSNVKLGDLVKRAISLLDW